LGLKYEEVARTSCPPVKAADNIERGEQRMRDENRTVYSTEWGRMCPNCGQPTEDCTCKQRTTRPQGDGTVRVSRESKGRKGKTVTIVTGVPLDDEALRGLLAELKRMCGSGGTLKEGVIEIQGDHRDKLAGELVKRGFKVKIAGG
jgi:translation initiation factor 1